MAKRLRKRTSKKARPSQAIEQDDDRGREHVNEKTALEQPEIRKESSVQASEPVSYTHLTLPTICSV